MHLLRVFFLLGFLFTAALATLFAVASTLLQRFAMNLQPPARARILIMPLKTRNSTGKHAA